MRKFPILLIAFMMLACEARLFPQDIIPNAVTDIDGNSYNAVRIGEQVWLAENMRAKRDRNGQEFLCSYDAKKDTSIYKPYCYYPNFAVDSVEKYGCLYNWPAATEVCPEGWHLPYDHDWMQLIEFVDSIVNGSWRGEEQKIVEALSSAVGWKNSHYNVHRNNLTGFSVLPAGNSYCGNCFGYEATFWNATAHDYRNAYTFGICENVLPHHKKSKEIGYSVRCVQDKKITLYTTFIPNAVTDMDGNTYNAVQIGEQIWMAENMRTTKARDGRKIALDNRASTEIPHRYCPGNDPQNVPRYGYLYNWAAAMKICPQGWHLPTDDEWTQLTNFISSQEQYCTDGDPRHIAKALASQEGWLSDRHYGNLIVGNEPEKNNATFFSALPAGMFAVWEGDDYGHCLYLGSEAHFWTSTEHNEVAINREMMCITSSGLSSRKSVFFNGYSVRCVRD